MSEQAGVIWNGKVAERSTTSKGIGRGAICNTIHFSYFGDLALAFSYSGYGKEW
jgi:hypothetical protein